MTRVGVVVPNLNYARWLPRAIQSIWDQTRRVDQVIMVDSGSQDDSQRIATEIGVQVLYCPPGSIGRARNAGISELWTDLVIPLDSDDWLEPTFVERTLAMIEEGCDVAGTGLHYRWEGSDPGQWAPEGGVQWPDEPITLERLMTGNRLFTCSMFRRSLWEQVGGYPEERACFEDWALWLKMARAGARFGVVKEPLFNYFLHKDSSTPNVDVGLYTERTLACL